MAAAIAGIFDDKFDAGRALTRLLEAGFLQEEISIVVSDHGRERIFTGVTTVEKGATDAIGGGLAGGVLGALLGGLTVVGNLVVPGSGVLAAGPIVAAFSGAGVGAARSGLSGALVAAGFSEDDAGKYEKELHAGKAVIVVHPRGDQQEITARTILHTAGAATKTA